MVTKAETGTLQLSMQGEIKKTPRSALRYSATLFLTFGLAWIGMPNENFGDDDVASPLARAAVMRASHDRAAVEVKPGRDVADYPESYFVGEAEGQKENDEHADGRSLYDGTTCYADGGDPYYVACL